MDGREGMTLQGSASYYLNRGIGGSVNSGAGPNIHNIGGGSGAPHDGGMHHTSAFKNHSNSNIPLQHQNMGVSSGGGSGSAFNVENTSHNFSHGMSMAMVPSGSQVGETVKKKRGRPRKYAPDGANMSLALSPISASRPSSAEVNSGERARRGRPPGSGWKQKLAPLGDWMNSSAGLAFTPHVLHVGIGEDIAAKLLAFAKQRPRALCILSATGSVSAVTLTHPTASGGSVTYEGRFEILCLSGSYLVDESSGPRERTGGISISVCSPDGHILGGAIGGRLIAANPVQVVGCSFVYGGTKGKNKIESGTNDEKFLLEHSAEKSMTPINVTHSQNLSTPNSGTNVWPSSSRPDVKNPDIDLMRG